MTEKEKIVEVESEQELSDETLISFCEDCNLMEYFNEYETNLLSNF